MLIGNFVSFELRKTNACVQPDSRTTPSARRESEPEETNCSIASLLPDSTLTTNLLFSSSNKSAEINRSVLRRRCELCL